MSSGGGFNVALFAPGLCRFAMQMPDPDRDLKCTLEYNHPGTHLMAYEFDAIEDDEQVAGVHLADTELANVRPEDT